MRRALLVVAIILPLVSERKGYRMTLRVIATGRTLSGKTEWIWRRYLRRVPRLLIVDTIGEWAASRAASIAGAHFTVGVEETLDCIATIAPDDTWRIVADLEREELVELADVLAPRRIEASPVPALGGMAIYLDEVDLLVPLGDARLGGLWRRGRHVGLSVYAATQRPSSVNKEVSAMVDVYGVLPLDEVRDVQYLRQRFGRENADAGLAWANSGPYRVAAFAGGELARLPPEPG